MLADLIARVEAAEGPDRELDVLVASFTGLELEGTQKPVSDYILECGLDWLVRNAQSYQSVFKLLPAYSASLDAAMTLVPDGWFWLRKCQSTMTVVQPATEQKGWATHTDGKGATPALALLAACLKARG